MSTTTNGRARKTLADQLDRLDGIIDALADGLNEAVATVVEQAVATAVQAAVTEVLTNPVLQRRLSGAGRAVRSAAGPQAPDDCAGAVPGSRSRPAGRSRRSSQARRGAARTARAGPDPVCGRTLTAPREVSQAVAERRAERAEVTRAPEAILDRRAVVDRSVHDPPPEQVIARVFEEGRSRQEAAAG
jgi:hypothetical protein